MNTNITAAREAALKASEQMQEARKLMADTIKSSLENTLLPLFDEYPFLGSLSWAQYTPYFNDGDPCTFTSNFSEASVNSIKDIEEGTASEGGYENGEYFAQKADETRYRYVNDEYTSVPNEDYDPIYGECKAAIDTIVQALTNSETDQALLTLFGDHAQITVTREGIEVDEYYHD